MPSELDSVSRRTILKRTGLASGGLVLGAGAFAGQAAATEQECGGCLRACWLDVKPSSCPNSVNPHSSGVLPVTSGWPNFDLETVELVPVKGEYDAAFDDCQNWQDPQYHTDSQHLTNICEMAMASDRAVSPLWWTIEDVDGDGDDDTKFKFDLAELQLEPDDTYLVLRGEDRDSDCTYLGIDSVRVLSNGGTNDATNTANGNPNGHH